MIRLLAFLGSIIALTAVNGCFYMWVDEIEMPKSLL